MLYSEALKNPKVMEALQKAGVDHIESPLVEKGDFVFINGDELHPSMISAIIDNETLYRPQHEKFKQSMTEHEKRMEPFKQKDARIAKWKPLVSQVISGRITEAYQTISEKALARMIATELEEKFGDPDRPQKPQDTSTMSELDRLLAAAGVARLSTLSAEEQATQFIMTNYSTFFIDPY